MIDTFRVPGESAAGTLFPVVTHQEQSTGRFSLGRSIPQGGLQPLALRRVRLRRPGADAQAPWKNNATEHTRPSNHTMLRSGATSAR